MLLFDTYTHTYPSTSTMEQFLLKDTYQKVQLCQRIDTSKIAQKLPKQSVPDVYSVILECKETPEAELIGSLQL